MTGPRQQPAIALLDACAVLTLYATQRMEEILSAMHTPAAIAVVVVREALFIRQIVDGQVENERVNLSPFIDSGLLAVVQADDEMELLSFIDLAVDLDDGEAMSAALAINRSWALVTDDRKAERLLGGRVQLRPTLALIKDWADAHQITNGELRTVLTKVDQRGYRPGSGHSHNDWWERVMSSQ